MEKTIKIIRKTTGMALFCVSFPLLASDGLLGVALSITGMVAGYYILKPYIPEK